MTLTPVEPPWEVHTPRGKADVLAVIDYSQESYVYFLTAARGSGEFWVYRNDKCQLFWNESTGLGKKIDEISAEEPKTEAYEVILHFRTGSHTYPAYFTSWKACWDYAKKWQDVSRIEVVNVKPR